MPCEPRHSVCAGFCDGALSAAAPSASLDGRSRRRWVKAVEGALTAVLHTVPASPSYRVTKLAGFTPVVAMERAEELRKRFHNHFWVASEPAAANEPP